MHPSIDWRSEGILDIADHLRFELGDEIRPCAACETLSRPPIARIAAIAHNHSCSVELLPSEAGEEMENAPEYSRWLSTLARDTPLPLR